MCCIEIPDSEINKGASSSGILDFTVYVNGVSGSWPGGKHTISYLPEGYDANFDDIVAKVKKKVSFPLMEDIVLMGMYLFQRLETL